MSPESLPHLASQIRSYLEELCVRIPNRHVGSSGNRQATDFFLGAVASFGFQVEARGFDCIDWEHGEVTLTVDGDPFTALVSPYSPACSLLSPVCPVGTVEELESADITGQVALLHSQIACEQLMPKGYPFYNPEEHQRIISLLEAKQPRAIIAATSRNPATSGAVYPFPMFEDGNFDIPSVYMTAEEGARLLKCAGLPATLAFESRRVPSRSCNVIARKGRDQSRRVLFCAHVDTKKGTPGALDNATGVATLLALAESLQDYAGGLGIEIVAMNGEDYYAAPGELQYLAQNGGNLDEVMLAINLDAAGYRDGRTAYSLYGCPDKLASLVRANLPASRGFVEGEPWYQSDHMVFAMNGRPAVAITSEKLLELSSEITHTEKDRVELADPEKLGLTAMSLRNLFLALSEA